MTTAALGAAGLALGTENARAQVSSEFSVPSQTFRPDDNELSAVWATAHGQWEFQGLDTDPDEWRVYLLADEPGNPGNYQAIDMTSGSVTNREATGDYALRGEITAASHYDSSTFDVSDGESVTVDIPLSVLFMVMDGGGDTLTEASARETVPVTVQPGGSVSVIGGEGAIHAVDNQGDPTPTVPSGGN